MTLMKEKRLSLGGVELALALDAGRVERLKRSAAYRYGLRPALDLAGRLRPRRNGHAAGPARAAAGGTAGAAPAEAVTLRAGATVTPQAQAIRDRVAALEWYHTLELPHGVVTPGFADHRAQVPLYGLPADMRGLRALDVATFDGFWAFEMERRGAQVVAVDLESWAECDVPRRLLKEALEHGGKRVTGPTFELAKELLGSQVERRLLSVYDLSPDKVGTFDLVFVSDLLVHLRDPQRALESIFTVTRPSGCVIVAEPYNPQLEGLKDGLALAQFTPSLTAMTWWLPSTEVLRWMLRVAAFDRVEEVSRFRLQVNSTDPIHKVVLKGHPTTPQPGPSGDTSSPVRS